MKLPIFIILSVLASIAGAWKIGHDFFGKELIQNFIWPQDSKDITRFSSQQKVVFEHSYFENFTHAIADQFKNVKELEFSDGTVLQVQLKKYIEKLSIWSSKTKNVEIDPSDEYAIVEMTVDSCELTSIPKYTNRLRRLRTLYLFYNKIESVKMTDFNGLNNLEVLFLIGNGMKTLSSESTIHLPKLNRISLKDNNLREINVCSWDMPTLEKFYLSNNKLKFVVNLVDQFPMLSEISISDNPLVCQWKDNLVRSLESKNISLYSGPIWNSRDTTCNATDETHVPTECPTVYSLSNQLSGLLERQRSFEQSMRNSTKKIESLEQMVKKSTEESKTFRQSMETFKQHALGKQTALEKTVAVLIDQLAKSSTEIVTLQQMAKKSNDENKSLKQTVTTLTDQYQRMAKKSNEENQSLKQTVTTLTDQLQRVSKKSNEEIQSFTNQLTKSSTEIVLLQQMARKSNEENQSLNQTVTTLTDQLQRMANKSNEENQLLTNQHTKSSTEIVLLQQIARKSNEENQSLNQTVTTLTDQLSKMRHSIDDLTEGFYRYVLEKEGGEK